MPSFRTTLALALRKVFPRWPAPCSEAIPAQSTWLLKDYVAWRMLNDRDTRLIAFEDKLAIKNIAEGLGVPFIPVLAQLDPVTIDINSHPKLQVDRFVLKMNHGWNDVVFIQRIGKGRLRLSGPSIDGEYLQEQANTRLRQHFIWWSKHVHAPREWALSKIWPRVLFAEPYLPLNDDYKVFVIRGRAELIMTITGRWDAHGEWGGYFDRNWNCLGADHPAEDRFGNGAVDRVTAHFTKPRNLETLLSFAERMVPSDMTFMRVDFYLLPDGAFVLGEGAAYSAGGNDHAKPHVEVELGKVFWRALRRVGQRTNDINSRPTRR